MNVLFWSGGKDSLLALYFFKKKYGNALTLLTTYDETNQMVPFQNISLDTIQKQADTLQLPHIAVGLPPKASNAMYLQRVLEELSNLNAESLFFGDWSLVDIKEWRKLQFEPEGFSCRFPIWQKPFNTLMSTIESLNAIITITYVSSIYQNHIKKGERYTRAWVKSLPPHIDPMGENGEFHTCIRPESLEPFQVLNKH